jgi:hypothetical protein
MIINTISNQIFYCNTKYIKTYVVNPKNDFTGKSIQNKIILIEKNLIFELTLILKKQIVSFHIFPASVFS